MRVTKYNQSCLIIETNNKRILIDPGKFGYVDERFTNDWIDIDIILVTHKHGDHCYKEIIEQIIQRDSAQLYITKEIQDTYNFTKYDLVKADDIIQIDDIVITVTKAIHGFWTAMKYSGSEIKENIGYIIDDGQVKLYTTSDTINFNNDYQCDVLCMPFNGNGLTMGIIDGTAFAKEINPKLLLPIHMEHPNPMINQNISALEELLNKEEINYKILEIKESIEI